jgi:hypothetical protein
MALLGGEFVKGDIVGRNCRTKPAPRQSNHSLIPMKYRRFEKSIHQIMVGVQGGRIRRHESTRNVMIGTPVLQFLLAFVGQLLLGIMLRARRVTKAEFLSACRARNCNNSIIRWHLFSFEGLKRQGGSSQFSDCQPIFAREILN